MYRVYQGVFDFISFILPFSNIEVINCDDNKYSKLAPKDKKENILQQLRKTIIDQNNKYENKNLRPKGILYVVSHGNKEQGYVIHKNEREKEYLRISEIRSIFFGEPSSSRESKTSKFWFLKGTPSIHTSDTIWNVKQFLAISDACYSGGFDLCPKVPDFPDKKFASALYLAACYPGEKATYLETGDTSCFHFTAEIAYHLSQDTKFQEYRKRECDKNCSLCKAFTNSCKASLTATNLHEVVKSHLGLWDNNVERKQQNPIIKGFYGEQIHLFYSPFHNPWEWDGGKGCVVIRDVFQKPVLTLKFVGVAEEGLERLLNKIIKGGVTNVCNIGNGINI